MIRLVKISGGLRLEIPDDWINGSDGSQTSKRLQVPRGKYSYGARLETDKDDVDADAFLSVRITYAINLFDDFNFTHGRSVDCADAYLRLALLLDHFGLEQTFRNSPRFYFHCFYYFDIGSVVQTIEYNGVISNGGQFSFSSIYFDTIVVYF